MTSFASTSIVCFPPCRRFLARVVLAACLVAATAANAAPKTDYGQTVAAAVENSRASYASGNATQAEHVVLAVNRFDRNSPHWNLESAFLLSMVAERLSAHGDAPNALDAAQRALKYLNQAVHRAGGEDDGIASAAEQLAGSLYESYVGDIAAAKSHYANSVKLSPDQQPAKDALNRLTQADAQAAAKGRKTGNR